MGSETEYTTGMSEMLVDSVRPSLIAHVENEDELWLRNGGRLYIDKGIDKAELVEYATPECTNGHQVLLHEKIGQQVVRNLGAIVEIDTDEQNTEPSYRQLPVYKRTGYGMAVSEIDEKLKIIQWPNLSMGHHETYQTGLDQSELAFYRPFLEAYLATRVVWSGTGMVADDGFRLSQKAEAIDFYGDGLITHGKKKAMRNRGRGLIEIRTGEGNMSDWAIRQKFDMTSLIFRLMEHRQVPFNGIIRQGMANAAFRGASRNPLAPLPSDGHRIDAIDVQQRIAEHAAAFAEKHGAPENELKAAHDIINACDDLNRYFMQDADLSIISDRIDWAAKLDKLRSRGIEVGRATCANLVAVAHDLSWEDVSLSGGANRWYKHRQPSVYDESDLRRNATIPPSARARNRVDLIDSYGDDVRSVSWDVITTHEGDSHWIDPL